MSMELGPYTNFHELNQDWFLNEFNKVLAEWADMNKRFSDLNSAFNDLRNYVHDYFNNLDVQVEIDNKLDSMAEDGSLYAIIRKYTDPIVNEQNVKINVLNARMDTFTSLPDGSTSGDAELTDIRVGYNGYAYASAGDAVRGQVSELNGDLPGVETKIINVLASGNIKNGGGNVSPINIDFSCRTFVKIKNKSSNQAYFSPGIYQNGVLKQGYSELYNAGEEKIKSIFNVNSDGIHWGFIESGKDITSYEWKVGIQNIGNVAFEYEIFQLKSDSPIRDNNTIIVDVNNDYGCFKYISDAIGYAKSKFDVNTVPITIFIKNGK